MKTVTLLRNGLRVVTDGTPWHFAALGAYVDCGLRFESPATSGYLHLLDRMAWKLTLQRLGVAMTHSLAQLGGNYMCGAQRELVMYQALVFNSDVEKMFSCIAETIREPKLLATELEEAVQTLEYERSELVHKHDQLLTETLHETAYGKKSLGNPLFGRGNVGVDERSIRDFHQRFYAPNNTVVAMVGVEHQAAVDLAERYLGDWAAGHRAEKVGAGYVGGETHLAFQEPRYSNLPRLVHMQVAFHTGGLSDPDLYALATLQKLLGGGSSFSAGGPGKGMFSRLFRVLNQYPFVENCLAFHHAYTDSGLFGITMLCYVDHAEYMAQIIAQEFAKCFEVEATELQRAKNQVTAQLLMNVESRLAVLEDTGRQVQWLGQVTEVGQMVGQIEALAPADVAAVARRVCEGLAPAVVVQGDRAEFGDVEFVLRHFGLGLWDTPKRKRPRDYRGWW